MQHNTKLKENETFVTIHIEKSTYLCIVERKEQQKIKCY